MKEFKDYFEDSMKWVASHNISDPAFFALLDAKIQMDNDLRLQRTAPIEQFKQELTPLSGFIAQIQNPVKSEIVKAGSEVIADNEFRCCVMFDSIITKGAIEAVQIDEQSITITLKLSESVKCLSLYVQGTVILKNHQIYKDNLIVGKITQSTRSNFLPQRKNPFFMLYQTAILPEQHNFFDLEISLPSGTHSIQISAYSNEASFQLNYIPIINIFKYISGYYDFDARAGAYKIPCDSNIMEVTKVIGKNGEIIEYELDIEDNVAKITIKNTEDMLSIEAHCITPINHLSKAKVGAYNANIVSNATNLTFQYDNLYEIMTKNLFYDENIIPKINQMYKIPNLPIKLTLTEGIAVGEYWKRACPKYICTIQVNQLKLLPFAIAWSLTLQKLCDINCLCEAKIITPIGQLLIKDLHE